jgi:murein DD-endopeptidase MepM/ murein hydrolase activator NlpD
LSHQVPRSVFGGSESTSHISPARENLEVLALRVNALQNRAVRLDTWGKKLVLTGKVVDSSMSLSWDKVLIKQQRAAISRQRISKRISENKITSSKVLVSHLSRRGPVSSKSGIARKIQPVQKRVRSKPIQTVQSEKRENRQLIRTSSTQPFDFSLSWDKFIKEEPRVTRNNRTVQLSRFSPMTEVKRSIQIVSRDLLRQYRSSVKDLPEGWPLNQGRISSKFGWRGKRMHKGLDIAAQRGTPIFAVEDGVVKRSKFVGAYGNLVEIKHSNMYSTRYGHNSKLLVKVNDYVSKGQVIALVGSTGRSTGPHVHFEVRQLGVAIDPIKYLGVMEYFSLAENIKLSEYVKLSKK